MSVHQCGKILSKHDLQHPRDVTLNWGQFQKGRGKCKRSIEKTVTMENNFNCFAARILKQFLEKYFLEFSYKNSIATDKGKQSLLESARDVARNLLTTSQTLTH